MKVFLIALFVFVLSMSSLVAVERLLQPYNLNFEDAVPGVLPSGWYMAVKFEERGFMALANNTDALRGNNCLQFSYTGKLLTGISDTISYIPDTSEQLLNENKFDAYGFVYQSVDGKDFRGKRVKFKVAIFTENLKDSAHCRIRLTAHLLKEKPSQNFIGDTIRLKKGWNYYEISGEIDNDADMINYGVLLTGQGHILIDDVSIEFENENSSYNVIDNHELNHQEIENLTAFAKLFGYVRYFYPGFEVAELDWEKFALTGVEYIQSAINNTELVERLKKLYLPIAPGLQIQATRFVQSAVSSKNSFSANKKPADALDNIALSWLHKGAPVGIPITNFSNELKNIYLPTRQREAPAIQILDALPLRGKTVRFSAFIKTDVLPPDGHAQLWLGIDNSKEQVVVFNSSIEKGPITGKKWTKHWIDAEIPKDASIIRLGLVMLGDGKIWFDNTSFQVLENGKETEQLLTGKNFSRNSGFEDGVVGELLLGWTFPESAVNAGYTFKTTSSEKYEGKNSLLINSDEKTRIIMPKPDEHIQFELAANVYVDMPLANYVDSTNTLPKPSTQNKPILDFKPNDFVINSKDRFSRFAVITLLWNVNRHFAIGVNENIMWEELLKSALTKASTDVDNEFINTLNMMLAGINDGQAKAWLNNNELMFGLPLLWRWVANELVVYETTDSTIAIPLGSVIKAINNNPVDDLTNNLLETISGNTGHWKKLRAAAILKGGIENENVDITFITPNKVKKSITLTRNINLFEFSENRPPVFHIINEDDYYFDLTRLTDRGLKNIVNDLKDRLPGAKTMIFDLRGYTNISEEFLGLFIKNKVQSVIRKYPVFSMPGGKPCTFFELGSEILPMNPYLKANVYFLIDERTSGGAEILSALAKKYKIGKLIGTTSSGTADEVLGINLPGEFNASIVGMLVELPGSNIDLKKGIEPDVTILPSQESLINGQDEILDYVYGFLSK